MNTVSGTTQQYEEKSSQTFYQSSPALTHQIFFMALIVIGLAVFFLMWFSVVNQVLFFHWDETVNTFFIQLRENASAQMTSAARWFGKAGSQGITIITILILTFFAFKRRFRRFWLLFACVVGVELLWLPVVFGIGRPRPTEVRTVGDILLPGLPSGHVMIFIAFFGALLYLYALNIKKRGFQLLIALVSIGLLMITGSVRLYFNAHYLTDVIAGYGLGLAWTAFALWLVEWIFYKRQQA